MREGDPPTDDVAASLAGGTVRFFGLELRCEENVLVPRAETELLARTALELLSPPEAGATSPLTLLDLGCGAGNLTCALAWHLPAAHVWACDLSPDAVRLTRRNADDLGLGERVTVRQGDLFEAIGDDRDRLRGCLDAILCNPPYLSSSRVDAQLEGPLAREPRAAFDGGPFGIAFHQRVAREAGSWLRPGGRLLFEVGAGQARQVLRLLDRAGGYREAVQVADPGGVGRVVWARR
ncbi:MAG: N5-glutamine methyltransferase family protein [Solirubrobacteraceae bacterium]